MRKNKLINWLLMLIFLVGCRPLGVQPALPLDQTSVKDSQGVTAIPQSGLTLEALNNSTFLSPQFDRPIQLHEGTFSEETNGNTLSVVLQPETAFGDLNADGMDDAVVLLAENGGGSGVFVSLVMIYSSMEGFKQAPGILIDDRPMIKSLSIENGIAVLEAVVHGPADTMVSPTVPVRQEFQLYGSQVLLTRLTSQTPSGLERSITITSPQENEITDSLIRVSGSMPIGPFENNLRLRILDIKGNELLVSGFMVESDGVGGRAVFDQEIALPTIAPGSVVLLELSEQSMADGSYLSLDSVALTIK